MVVIVSLLVLRRPILDLLADPALQRVKAGPVEADWDRTAAKVERNVATNAALTDAPPVSDDEPAAVPPSDAIARIMTAHLRLTQKLAEVAHELVPPIDNMPSDLLGLTYALRQRRAISEATENSIEGIDALYGLARARPHRVTISEANEFEALSIAVMYSVESNMKRSR